MDLMLWVQHSWINAIKLNKGNELNLVYSECCGSLSLPDQHSNCTGQWSASQNHSKYCLWHSWYDGPWVSPWQLIMFNEGIPVCVVWPACKVTNSALPSHHSFLYSDTNIWPKDNSESQCNYTEHTGVTLVSLRSHMGLTVSHRRHMGLTLSGDWDDTLVKVMAFEWANE